MRKKIQRSMVMVLAVTLLLSYAIITIITYNRNIAMLEAEVRQEARYIQAAINISGPDYLAEMNGVDWTTRVTQISPEGEVLYDTRRDESTLEDHSGRKEVREALASGEGEDVRMSDTVGQELYYYALLLDDGTVLRASKSMDGLIGTALILITGGDLNGPTLGGIFAVMGFSAFGKHARNILPIMAGVVIGGVCMHWRINNPSVQLAMLFGTTLAPISGYFGWPFGILAGFLHSSVVLHAGTPVEGVNLYNNGYSGGLLAIVLYPLLTEAIRHRRPELEDKDYFDVMEHDEPQIPPPARRR